MSEANKYVIIIDKANGNESVGTEWQETKIFEGYYTLDEVMHWALDGNNATHSSAKITITKPHRDKL